MPSGEGCGAFAELADDWRARMIIGEQGAVTELWDAASPRLPPPREDRPGQPVYVLDEAPEPGETGLRAATPDDFDLLLPACAAAHREEIGIDPLERDPEGFRWRTRAQIDEGRSWLWAERRNDPLQGRSLRLDAARSPAATGLGRPGGTRARLCAARVARPLPPATPPRTDRLPVRPPRQCSRDPGLRGGRDAAHDLVSEPDLLRRVRRLAYVALGLWVGRWVAMELASYAGHRLLPPGPPPRESARRPGWMPLRVVDRR